MTNNDRKPDDRAEEQHPIDPPVKDDERYQLDKQPGGVTDAGKTSGGGSLGHMQPDEVEREAPLRNNAAERKS